MQIWIKLSGPKRGGIVQKDGKDVIIDYNEHSYSIVDQDFSSFNIKKHSFLDRSPYLYDEKYSGYYELKTDNFITEIKESSVNYKCQAFVRFVEAIIENTPEVKEVGKPYQAPKKELKIIKESEWFPVYKCSKYSKNDYICGIDNNMDNWARTELLFIESEIFVREEELEMVESLWMDLKLSRKNIKPWLTNSKKSLKNASTNPIDGALKTESFITRFVAFPKVEMLKFMKIMIRFSVWPDTMNWMKLKIMMI
jgi:hypothetical protein